MLKYDIKTAKLCFPDTFLEYKVEDSYLGIPYIGHAFHLSSFFLIGLGCIRELMLFLGPQVDCGSVHLVYVIDLLFPH